MMEVDSCCDAAPGSTVFEDYTCLLNQTNIIQNNNKFFVVQLVQEPGQSLLIFLKRWGRVGKCNVLFALTL